MRAGLRAVFEDFPPSENERDLFADGSEDKVILLDCKGEPTPGG